MHVEGVIKTPADASLHVFFRSIGGHLARDRFTIPVEDGVVKSRNNDTCPDGNPGTLQGFVHKTVNGKVVSEKLDDFAEYVLSPESIVPPGDCIILEFTTTPSNTTDKICSSYEAAIQRGDFNGG